eukprot:TRINITY_DN5008_c0_g1_i1.p1 TRINITY_DN5008_c0_g1~~TRINITY_DN5008_c0_g1_i1.p1  ORF type:complete len:260 (-),score=62.61 TRINITY_DN5008_c0_g1_i1:106-885(-)
MERDHSPSKVSGEVLHEIKEQVQRLESLAVRTNISNFDEEEHKLRLLEEYLTMSHQEIERLELKCARLEEKISSISNEKQRISKRNSERPLPPPPLDHINAGTELENEKVEEDSAVRIPTEEIIEHSDTSSVLTRGPSEWLRRRKDRLHKKMMLYASTADPNAPSQKISPTGMSSHKTLLHGQSVKERELRELAGSEAVSVISGDGSSSVVSGSGRKFKAFNPGMYTFMPAGISAAAIRLSERKIPQPAASDFEKDKQK